MAIVYMTEEGYKKMLEEITFLETVKGLKYQGKSRKLVIKATSRKMRNMMRQKRRKVYWK